MIHPDGTVQDSAITWDAVSEDSYAEKGSFAAGGTVDGTDMRVEVTVMVVEGEAANVALIAQPSAIINTPRIWAAWQDSMTVMIPQAPENTSHGVWHNCSENRELTPGYSMTGILRLRSISPTHTTIQMETLFQRKYGMSIRMPTESGARFRTYRDAVRS